MKKYNRGYVAPHMDRRRVYAAQANKAQRLRDRQAVLNAYGRVCACCSESRYEFLAIDHIEGGGKRHRIQIRIGLDRWLVKNSFPDGYRILCHNCNMALGFYGYCPHGGLSRGRPETQQASLAFAL